MRTIRRGRTVALLALVLAGGCADTGGRAVDRAAGDVEPAAAPTVLIANNNWSTVVAHAFVDGRRYRLGQVETGGRSTFTLPSEVALAPEIEVVVDPIAQDAEYATGPIQVSPGSRVEVSVENNLALSNYRVWNAP